VNIPGNAKIGVKWNNIIRQVEPLSLPLRMSSRMVQIAANIPNDEWLGWQMQVPTKGTVEFKAFGTSSIKKSDLEWIAEETADVEEVPNDIICEDDGVYDDWTLFEVSLAISEKDSEKVIGFSNDNMTNKIERTKPDMIKFLSWPLSFSTQFGELVEALRIEGAAFRFAVGKASFEEQRECVKHTRATWSSTQFGVSDYMGQPVRAKLLLLLPHDPTARIRAIVGECVSGATIKKLGMLSNEIIRSNWECPISSPIVLPDFAARIMSFEPIVGSDPVIGVEARDPEAKLYPARHKDSISPNVITIGTATGISGLGRNITISDIDLQRHWQVIGQTGTGKSTLLATAIKAAIETGHGLTFFDPHGSTIDTVLHTIPEKYAGRIRVVHIGDLENPVPINMWETDDPLVAEKTISDMCLLFSDLFDPNHEGTVGPRWERWFSLFSFAAIALLGKKASFETIMTLSRDKINMNKLSNALRNKYPAVSQAIRTEFANNSSSDFADLISWCVSKFQRLTSIEQLRNTLGAGANALDFDEFIDSDTVTLIDLSSPTIGTQAARVCGTLLLMQLWSAILQRKNRNDTHVVVIDEAHLFQTNPLPQMLAESRKFGIGMILAHQHNNQLSVEVREALSANSANFSAFRLSVRDAYEVGDRFDEEHVVKDLSRLNAFNAFTTLSIDGKQTPTFTLKISKSEVQKESEAIAQSIEERSRRTLVDPYRNDKPISDEDLLKILSEEERAAAFDMSNNNAGKSDFLKSWSEKKAQLDQQ
jgi:hypothetical protein